MSAWREMLRLADRAASQPLALASPFNASSLSKIVLSDIFGADDVPVTRAAAIAVPAVSRGRNLICGGLYRHPLKAYRGATELAASRQPSFLYRTNGAVSPQLRTLWTVDDLIFYGWSLWAVERGSENAILDAWRVPPEWWRFASPTDHTIVFTGGDTEQELTEESTILFAGPTSGLLEEGAHTIRAYENLERAWARRVRQPIPATELHQTTEDPIDPDEIRGLVDEWGAMLDEGSGVAYTPYSIEVKPHGEAKTDLFVEGRNAATQDVARLLNLPSTMLDASMATASLQYSTRTEGRNEFIDHTLGFWATPIEARLSMDDVVPRGQRTGFDLSGLTEIPQTGLTPAQED